MSRPRLQTATSCAQLRTCSAEQPSKHLGALTLTGVCRCSNFLCNRFRTHSKARPARQLMTASGHLLRPLLIPSLSDWRERSATPSFFTVRDDSSGRAFPSPWVVDIYKYRRKYRHIFKQAQLVYSLDVMCRLAINHISCIALVGNLRLHCRSASVLIHA